jgi:ADP-heptose:LPS heptosyltransferase
MLRKFIPNKKGFKKKIITDLKNLVLDSFFLMSIVFGKFFYLFRSKNKNKTILLLRTDLIGDFILFSPMIRFINEAYQNYEIIIIVQDTIKEVAQLFVSPENIICFNKECFTKKIWYRILILKLIAKQNAEICINSMYYREEIGDQITLWSFANKRIAWNTKKPNMTVIKKKIGNFSYSNLFNDNEKNIHELKHNRHFLENLKIKVTSFYPKIDIFDIKNIPMWITTLLYSDKIKLVISVDSTKIYREWPIVNFVKLILLLFEKYKKEIVFILLSKRKNERFIASLYDKLPKENVINLMDKTSIREFISIIREGDLVVGHDSASVHIAAALNKPSVCILGGGHFGCFFPYPPELSKVMNLPTVVYNKMDCFGCKWNCIYSSVNAKDFPCISNIGINEVYNIIIKMLEKIKL